MKKIYNIVILLSITIAVVGQTSVVKISARQFFKDESVVEMKVTTDLRQMLSGKMKEGQRIRGKVDMELNNKKISEPVTIEVRGNMRKATCNMPPLKVNFKSTSAPALSSLGSLKLVNSCRINKLGIEYLFKEYLIYKMYNLVTDKSLRVRLLKITYIDSSGKKNPVDTYGFFLEDLKDMAKRNQCVERKRSIKHMELTERQHMARVAVFQYMIGNLDWSVRAKHNIKLIVPKKDTNDICFSVPYDFDYAGLVNADYAIPPVEFNLEDVTVRLYRGFARTPEELQVIADEFLKQKDNIYKLVGGFDLLSNNVRSKIIAYLEPFFDVISKPSRIKKEFIDNARND